MPVSFRSSGYQPTVTRGTARAGYASRFLIASARTIRTWIVRSAERRTLAQLTDWQLHDIGITRAEVDAEVDKWFWRL